MPKKTDREAHTEPQEESEAARILGNSFRSTEAEFPDVEPSEIHIAFDDPHDMPGYPDSSQDEADAERPKREDDLIFSKPQGYGEDDVLSRTWGAPDLTEQEDDGREELLTDLMVQLSAAHVPHHIIVSIGKLEKEPIKFNELRGRAIDILNEAIAEYEPKKPGLFAKSQAELVVKLMNIRSTIDMPDTLQHQDRPRKISGERAG